MKKLFGILCIFLCTVIIYSQNTDSTYLKKYETYLQQIEAQQKKVVEQLEILKQSYSELSGAKAILEALMAEEKKRLEEIKAK